MEAPTNKKVIKRPPAEPLAPVDNVQKSGGGGRGGSEGVRAGKMSADQLKAYLQANNLSLVGGKKDMLERVEAHHQMTFQKHAESFRRRKVQRLPRRPPPPPPRPPPSTEPSRWLRQRPRRRRPIALRSGGSR